MDVMEARENLELASSKDEVNQLRAENQGSSRQPAPRSWTNQLDLS